MYVMNAIAGRIRLNKILTYIFLTLISCSASMTMLEMSDIVDSNVYSIVTYLVLGCLSIIVIGNNLNLVLCGGMYITSICMFLAYMILRYCIIYDDIESIRLFANCVWPIISICGYIIGYQNNTTDSVNCIAKFILIIATPLLLYASFRNYGLYIATEDISKDAFFICIILFPCVFLLKSIWLQQVLLGLFFIMGIISFKRSIILVMVVMLIIYLMSIWKYLHKGQSRIFGLIVFIGIIGYGLVVYGQNILDVVLDRFNSLSDDGGSGRDVIYNSIIDDLGFFSAGELLFGKGMMSVVHLLGIDAHMDILQILHSLGLVGLFIYLLIYFACFRLIYKYRKNFRASHDDTVGLTFIISVICFISVANMNCFIFNPSFIVPMMFVIGLQAGIISARLKTVNRI